MVDLNSRQDITKIDWHDSEEVFKFGVETIQIARDYQDARKDFARALKQLKLGLAKAYAAKDIERKLAEDKAYLVMAEWNDEYRDALRALIDKENEYKGLEKVLETRQAVMSLVQSLIKNRVDNE